MVRNLCRIAVDLTPVLPGGENGGAKIVALELVKKLAEIAPGCEFILLTRDNNHDELSFLDAKNVKRLIAAHARNALALQGSGRLSQIRDILAKVIPDSLLAKAIEIYRSRPSITGNHSLLQKIKADLLFCPFTAPVFFDPEIPTVSIIHEILYLHYPQFFAQQALEERDRYFKDACWMSDILVCVSNHLRQDVIARTGLSPDRVVSALIRLSSRLGNPCSVNGVARLDKWGLEQNSYFLYPANFWPHKNHKMLLTAFGIFRKRHPGSRFKLACPGSPETGMAPLQEAAKRMRLENQVIFPGYLAETEMAAFYKYCRALIYPSLYEGFGMPILEAQNFGKPVLASRTTSIPEITGPNTILFNPKNVFEIVTALEKAETTGLPHPDLCQLSDSKLMAVEYLNIFKKALNRKTSPAWGCHAEGLFPDQWTSACASFSHDAGLSGRNLKLSLTLPFAFPYPAAYLQLKERGARRLKIYLLRRGKNLEIQWPLSSQSGAVELSVQPLFQPKAHGLNNDERWLGCLVNHWSIS